MRKKIGRYEVKKEITEGGQGKIYLAHDPLLKIDLAIKELLAPEGEHEREAFEREVLNMRTLLRSANIVRTYDFFTEGKNEYIGMEYVDGMSLFDLIVWQEGLPLSLSMFIFRQICQGLSDAHRKKIIHRDIKPQNILISRDGDVMLTDFGIAGKVEDFTREASAYGSIHFMAPEQLDRRRIKGDPKTDIYSLGATLYTMLFGKPPFMGDAKNGKLEAEIIEHNYKKPAELDPDIPAAVNELIVSMLEKDPEERPAIEEVIAKVEDYEKSLAEGIRNALPDALKASIASGEEKLDYRKLKLKDDWEPVDLCTPASLYTKNCSVQLSVDFENLDSNMFCPRLYALVFKCGDGGCRFHGMIELTRNFNALTYQSEEQEFEPGEYLVRFDFRDRTFLRSFSLRQGEKQHIVVAKHLRGYWKEVHLEPHALDAESGEDITDLAMHECMFKGGRRIQKPLEKNIGYFDVVLPFKISCEGYESRKLSLPPEIESCQRIVLTIPLSQKSGAGDMDFDIIDIIDIKGNKGKVLQRYLGSAASVTIPDGVTEIAAGAFRDCSSVSAVTIPGSVTEIGEQAFLNCNIQTLLHPCLTIRDGCAIKDGKLLYRASQEADCTVPDDITEIYGRAFAGCRSLRSVTISGNITAIGDETFEGCTSLASVTILEGVTEIGWEAFKNCTSLTAIEIPDSVTEIGAHAFSGCTSLTTVEIPDSVTEIGEYAFSDCTSLASVTIPKGVTKIGEAAFHGCKSLTAIKIPNSVKAIGEHAFCFCTSLESVVIPGNVTEIGRGVFRNCRSLASVTILEGVTEIGDEAFIGCTSLTAVEIPGSVIKIDGYAFKNCEALVSVVIPDSVTEIGTGAFTGCTSLTAVKIPATGAKIGNCAFSGCTSLESVDISKGVTEIGDNAFAGCTSLTTVKIPKSVTKIDEYAFRNCNIRELSHSCLTIRDGFAIKGRRLLYCAIQASVITIPEGMTKIGSGAFAGYTSLTSVKIPGSVTEIGKGAFSGCTSLTSVKIPSTVTKIDNSAFSGCTSLSSMIIPEGVTAIDCGVFFGCTSLESVTIPESVMAIRISAFEGCTSLASVVIPSSVTEIGGGTFKSCTSLASVTINEGVAIINFRAFSDCTSLASVTIPGSVTRIGNRAFENCTSLTSVTIHKGVTEICDVPFLGCTSLSEIRYAGTKVQWTAVKKDRDWHEEVPAKIVICSDGEVEL